MTEQEALCWAFQSERRSGLARLTATRSSRFNMVACTQRALNLVRPLKPPPIPHAGNAAGASLCESQVEGVRSNRSGSAPGS
jgi:hypothetical protein